MSIIHRAMEKKLGKKTAKNDSNPDQEADKPAKPPAENVQTLSDVKEDTPVRVESTLPTKKTSLSHKVELDFKRMKIEGYLTPDDTGSLQAEEYRKVKRPLLVNAFSGIAADKNRNTILITSSVPNEGKTYSALNLAISISLEKEKTVLLVDADLQVAGLSKEANLLEVAGLTDVLNHDVHDLKDVIYGTNLANLRIIPAGIRNKHSAELLASSDMELLVQELSNRYPDRIIIIDSPPLLARSESSVLTKLVGQVVLVVEAEHTMQNAVKEAIKQLEECEIVNMLLNKRQNRPGISDRTVYYGY
jgi:exopolysaccharide/PEP-CTERM locus tyrosine autokinase